MSPDRSKCLASLRVLVAAPVSSYGGHNTSRHRAEALRELVGEVEVVDIAPRANLENRVRSKLFKLGLPVPLSDRDRHGPKLLSAALERRWDVIFCDKLVHVSSKHLQRAKEVSGARLVGFSPDDMSGRHNQSQQFLDCLRYYDAFLTTKTFGVNELQELGAKKVLFVPNGYDPETFRPLPVSEEESTRLGGDIGFIGTFERERAESMLALARAGLSVKIWGGGWHKFEKTHPNLTVTGRPLLGDDYAKACGAFKINLGYLRKQNRDQQTTRSVEVPASGGFLLAERTDEHRALFREGMEAEYFSSQEELLRKCRYYLEHEDERRAIALAGLRRCRASGYSNADRLEVALVDALAP